MAERPNNLSDHPEDPFGSASGDLLSHVLAQIHLSGDGIVRAAVASGVELPLAPDAGHLCLVTDGAVRLERVEARPVKISAGDLVLLPHGDKGLRLVAAEISATVLLCRFRFDASSHRSMVAGLPSYIHIDRTEGASWLDGFMHFVTIEVSDVQPGAGLMISRLIDLAVIRTLRTWIQRGQSSGWLGGLSDERIARTLKAIHETPGQRWSIEALAGIAGMSRSSFCERFTVLVGRAPLRYQNEWRLTLARDLLSRPQARVGEIGLSIGYETEAAFSRAYKAFFGHSPRNDFKADGRSQAV
jgi:AraC-like DNA-binding protein